MFFYKNCEISSIPTEELISAEVSQKLWKKQKNWFFYIEKTTKSRRLAKFARLYNIIYIFGYFLRIYIYHLILLCLSMIMCDFSKKNEKQKRRTPLIIKNLCRCNIAEKERFEFVRRSFFCSSSLIFPCFARF